MANLRPFVLLGRRTVDFDPKGVAAMTMHAVTRRGRTIVRARRPGSRHDTREMPKMEIGTDLAECGV